MNLNDLAVEVTKLEGKKKSVSIAQVKEVMGIFLRMMAKESDADILKVFHRFRNEKPKPRHRAW